MIGTLCCMLLSQFCTHTVRCMMRVSGVLEIPTAVYTYVAIDGIRTSVVMTNRNETCRYVIGCSAQCQMTYFITVYVTGFVRF
jgi:hypothetical protein